MKTTIDEIARQSGVSKGTVSRVINCKSTVAETTRQNVLAVMKRLGYEPDPVARELSNRSKHILGIWVGEGENRLSPYFNVIWRALLREIQNRATQFVELPSDLTEVSLRMDAVLIFNCEHIEERLELLRKRGLPAVLIGQNPDISCVAPDDYGGGRLAAEHLLSLGHRKLLHLSTASSWAHERVRGFSDCVAESGLVDEPVLVTQGESTILGGYRLMRDMWLTARRPTGVFCASDEMAIGALGALSDLGVAVPEEVSVVGFDGLAELQPGLVSIGQNIPAIAHEAVSLASAAIEGMPPRQVIVPVALVEGNTTGVAPGSSRPN